MNERCIHEKKNLKHQQMSILKEEVKILKLPNKIIPSLSYDINTVKQHAVGFEDCSNDNDRLTSQKTYIIWDLIQEKKVHVFYCLGKSSKTYQGGDNIL